MLKIIENWNIIKKIKIIYNYDKELKLKIVQKADAFKKLGLTLLTEFNPGFICPLQF